MFCVPIGPQSSKLNTNANSPIGLDWLENRKKAANDLKLSKWAFVKHFNLSWTIPLHLIN